MKKKDLVYIAIFLILVLETFICVSHVLVDKTEKKSMYGFRYEKENTIDIVFLGNSHAKNGFAPAELWNDYGYTAYNMAMMSQNAPLVYFTAEDVFKMQHPKIMVVDLFAFTSTGGYADNTHKTIDNLTFETKMKAIKEIIPEDKKTEYYFPFYLYHDRWDELEYKDFIPYFLRYSPKKNARRGVSILSEVTKCNDPEEAIAIMNSGETILLSDEAIYWLDRLTTLCRDNGTEIIYAVVPYEMPIMGTYNQTAEQMKLYNAIEQWCAENGAGYINIFRNLDEIEFNFATNMADCSHVNMLGTEKTTRAIGWYIRDNYSVEDRRDEIDIASEWDEFYDIYLQEKNEAIIECENKIK